MIRFGAVLVLAGSVCAVPAAPATAGGPLVTYRVVAKSGDAAPTGGSFTVFGFPRMNEQGEVAFSADTSAVLFSSGVWSEGVGGPGSLALVAREGTAVPGSGNTLFMGEFAGENFVYFAPEINDRGNVYFSHRLIGAGVTDETDIGLARQVNGVLQSAARPLQLVPGIPGASLQTISNLSTFSDNDEVSVVTTIVGPGVNSDNDNLILRVNENGSLSIVMREGAAAPGIVGGMFTGGGLVYPLLNDVGQVSFTNYPEANGDFFWSIYLGAPGAPTLVVREGQQTPLGPGTEFLGNLISFGLHRINSAGHVLFPQDAMIGGQSRSGLWRTLGGPLQAVAVQGQASPLGNTYLGVGSFTGALGKDGRVAFRATIAQGGSVTADNDSALLMRFANGATQTIAREGQQAPGMINGIFFDHLSSSIAIEQVNDRGQVLFTARVRGFGVGESNDETVWATRLIGGPTLVMREGQIFEVAPGDFRLVSSFSVSSGYGSESGSRGGFNRLGQVLMRLVFADDSSAIVVATLQNDCFGDIDGDLDIDFADLNLLLDDFNELVGTGVGGDLDLDGDVDFADLNLLLNVFNTNCVPM